jgi:hypothetical protein
MIRHTFHIRSLLQFISLSIFHFPALFDVASPCLKNSSFIITFLTMFLKICDLQEKDASECRQLVPESDCPIYKGLFIPIPVLCFLALIFTIVIIPAQVAWSFFSLPPIDFHARSPVYALYRSQMRAIFLRCAMVPQTESFV